MANAGPLLTSSYSLECGSETSPVSSERVFAFLMTSKQCRDRTATRLIFTASMLFEPEKYVIYQGVLQGIPLGEVESGETKEMEMAICFVSCGRFELRGQVEILNAAPGELAGSGHITVLVEDERYLTDPDSIEVAHLGE